MPRKYNIKKYIFNQKSKIGKVRREVLSFSINLPLRHLRLPAPSLLASRQSPWDVTLYCEVMWQAAQGTNDAGPWHCGYNPLCFSSHFHDSFAEIHFKVILPFTSCSFLKILKPKRRAHLFFNLGNCLAYPIVGSKHVFKMCVLCSFWVCNVACSAVISTLFIS